MVVWGFGVGVLDLVFEVEVFSWLGLGPVVRGFLGFGGWSSLYKHKRITLGKKWCVQNMQSKCSKFNPSITKSLILWVIDKSHFGA